MELVYSYDGSFPQLLPTSFVDENGTMYTDLSLLSKEELNLIKWYGPIEMPPLEGTSSFTHDYKWNEKNFCFDAIEISTIEKESRVNYLYFWDLLITSGLYKKLKDSAKTSLSLNATLTEFITLINDAKNGKAYVEAIQSSIEEILSNVSFTADEMSELQEIFVISGMFAVYNLN